MVAYDDGAGRGHTGEAGQADELEQLGAFHGIIVLVLEDDDQPTRPTPPQPVTELALDDAVELTRTGDIWLFRGDSRVDHAIHLLTNAPVNHVGVAVVLDDLPPLMLHAELGKSLPDVWAGCHQRGVQLHDLRDAVVQWGSRYHQRGWLRQLDADITSDMEDALLRVIARLDGTPFPSTAGLLGRWARGRLRRHASAELTYCAEVVAAAYTAMGLLPQDRPPNFYDPGRFWSGDDLRLLGGARLEPEIAVALPEAEGADGVAVAG